MPGPYNQRELGPAHRPLPAASVAPLQAEGASISIGDVYFTIFRHKWKIIICALLGLAGAFACYKLMPPAYESEAKLFIRYVMDSRTPGRTGDDSNVRSPDSGGATILNSELEIITSLDLAGKVVDTVGVEKFLPMRNDGKDRDRAVLLMAKSLQAEVMAHSSVIHLTFTHSDPALVQPVLKALITNYYKKHVEIHRATGMVDDFLSQETDNFKNRLAQTEERLRQAKAKAGVASIEDAKKAVTDLSTRVRQSIQEAEMDLAERTAFIKSIESNSTVKTSDNGTKGEMPPDEAITAYGQAVARVDILLKTEQGLLSQFTPENNRVKEVHAQLTEAEGTKKKLEESYPSLAVVLRPVAGQPTQPANYPETRDLITEAARVKAGQAKIAVLNGQLAKLKEEAMKIDDMEAEIVELNRMKELEEANYRKYAASLEQARLDEAISTAPVSNISEIQSPSPALRAKSKKRQVMALLGIGGLLGGLAWAFVIELFLDHTIKRPIEVERKLNLPLLISIPVVNKALKRQLLALGLPNKTGPNPDADKQKLSGPESDKSANAIALQPFHATLRDRLIGYFENNNLTHKPKLIAVTGLAQKSGVSTIASGIAQSLSETGEGNVLLVSMHSGQDAAQQYFQGKPVTQLDDLLDAKKRAPTQENLYVVTEGSNSDRLLRNMPQRFSKLLPKLRASDFDYIIFDMPTVSQVSITPRLAGFMDIVLLVLESEKTDRGLIQKATTLLEQSKVHVGVVLNKTRSYVPPQLYQETLRDL